MSLNEALRRIKRSEGLLVTPDIDRWLVQHPEGVAIGPGSPAVAREALKRLLSDTSNHQRESRFGASSRGHCLRWQLFRYLGMPEQPSYDPRLQNMFNDGIWRHIRWQLMGLMAGVLTDVEVKFGSRKLKLRISADGANFKKEFLFEFKGTSQFSKFVMNGPPKPHLLQIHTMMLASGLNVCSYVIEDKMSQHFHELIIKEDRKIMIEVRLELEALNQAIEDKKLPAVLQGCRLKKGEVWQGCPYRHNCPEQDRWPEEKRWEEVEVRRTRRKR